MVPRLRARTGERMKNRLQGLDGLMASPRLPSLPAVALEVIGLSQEPDLEVAHLAETIANDPALAGKILRMANSSFYAQAGTVSTINQAIILLGLNDVRSLALSFALVDGLPTTKSNGIGREAFWRRSLITAAASRLIARRVGHHHAEEAFVGGLLCRLGVLALSITIPVRHGSLSCEAGNDYGRLRLLEAAELGFDHADAGGRLAELWKLPSSFAAAMGYVDDPDAAPEEIRRFVGIVSVGDCAAEVLSDAESAALPRYRDRCSQLFGSSESAADLLMEIEEASRDVLRLFDLPAESLPSVAEILGRANEALVRLNFEMSREKVRLEIENDVLGSQASTDPLTGLANRRHLVEFTQEQIRIAGRYRSPLSLLFLDVDHLKFVNDSFGHEAGDRMLRAVSSTLRRSARGADLVARYAGDEFVIVMPAAPLEVARAVAERVRRAVEDAEFTLVGGTSIRMTVSVGVASFDGNTDDQDSLFGRADRAVYHAKAAGGNRVMTIEACRAP